MKIGFYNLTSIELANIGISKLEGKSRENAISINEYLIFNLVNYINIFAV